MLLTLDLARKGQIAVKGRRCPWTASSLHTLTFCGRDKIARPRLVPLPTFDTRSAPSSLLHRTSRYELLYGSRPSAVCVPRGYLSTPPLVRSLVTLERPGIENNSSSIPVDKATAPLSSMEYSRPFTDLTNVQPSTLQAIQSTFGHKYMSKVQSRVLSAMPTTQDLLVKAKTGTGKTLAFLIAALESLMAFSEGEIYKNEGKIGCVIIAPTRELALQISDEASKLLNPLGWGVQYLVGGESRTRQLDRILKEPGGFVVATPGRLQDLLSNADFAAKVGEAKVLILDEADTMLELGFRNELNSILEAMPQDRQTFLFSATVDSKVDSLLEVALHRETMNQ
ncbi:hypothetical protein BGZ65_006721, partial [Modicella reniformis]